MTVEYRKGDIFTTEINVIGHGCNCVGSMGAGIALQVIKRNPEMLTEYQHRCHQQQFKPGAAWLWTNPTTGKSVLNLGTQYFPGANARLAWVKEALTAALSLNLEAFAIPRIGAGIGGLDWEEVKAAIEELSDQFPTTKVVIYEL